MSMQKKQKKIFQRGFCMITLTPISMLLGVFVCLLFFFFCLFASTHTNNPRFQEIVDLNATNLWIENDTHKVWQNKIYETLDDSKYQWVSKKNTQKNFKKNKKNKKTKK